MKLNFQSNEISSKVYTSFQSEILVKHGVLEIVVVRTYVSPINIDIPSIYFFSEKSVQEMKTLKFFLDSINTNLFP